MAASNSINHAFNPVTTASTGAYSDGAFCEEGTPKFGVDGDPWPTALVCPSSGSSAGFIGFNAYNADSTTNYNRPSALVQSMSATSLPPGPQRGLSSTTTTLQSSENPSKYGDSVTFTATVTTTGNDTPTGTVTFYDGSEPDWHRPAGARLHLRRQKWHTPVCHRDLYHFDTVGRHALDHGRLRRRLEQRRQHVFAISESGRQRSNFHGDNSGTPSPAPAGTSHLPPPSPSRLPAAQPRSSGSRHLRMQRPAGMQPLLAGLAAASRRVRHSRKRYHPHHQHASGPNGDDARKQQRRRADNRLPLLPDDLAASGRRHAWLRRTQALEILDGRRALRRISLRRIPDRLRQQQHTSDSDQRQPRGCNCVRKRTCRLYLAASNRGIHCNRHEQHATRQSPGR